MQKNPIGWVEIPVTDLDRAEKFYIEFFGFEMQRQEEKNGYVMSWFPMDMEGYGSGGMLMKGDGYTPSHGGSLVYFTAPGGTIKEALKIAEEKNIVILASKTDLGEHGFMAIVEDSEGNRIALHSIEG